jgi:CRISPR-associated exonuclease Cas4
VNEPTIALRSLEHFSYCMRQCALIHVDGVWADSEHTVKGVAGHKRADTAEPRRERGRLVVRGMELWNDQLGLFGRADAVEFSDDGVVEPVEYKIGVRHGESAELQVCAQALCLEEMFGIDINFGAVWFSRTRQKVRFSVTGLLREKTLNVIEEIRALHVSRNLPAPANDQRCSQCQLLGHCMPDLVAAETSMATYFAEEVYQCGYSTRFT